MPAAATLIDDWWHNTVVPTLLNDESTLDKLVDSSQREATDSRWRCTQGCVRGVRPYLVVSVLVITMVWLSLDVWKFDALEPGAKDAFMAETKLVSPLSDDVMDWYKNGNTKLYMNPGTVSSTFYSCPCAFSSDHHGIGLLAAPYTTLRWTDAYTQLNVSEALSRLAGYCNESAIDLGTEEGRITAAEFERFRYAASLLRIQPLPGSLLLTLPAWRESRLVDARSE